MQGETSAPSSRKVNVIELTVRFIESHDQLPPIIIFLFFGCVFYQSSMQDDAPGPSSRKVGGGIEQMSKVICIHSQLWLLGFRPGRRIVPSVQRAGS